MLNVTAPMPGDFVAWVVGMPGPDIDYALCIDRKDDKALLRFQVWQQPGPWDKSWVRVVSQEHRCGCWATKRLVDVGPALWAERARLFPEIAIAPGKE